MFYDHFYYIELNECTMKSKRHGIMVNGVFRDRNGINMPFLKRRIAKRFYTNMMIDEFSHMLIKAGPFDFTVFFFNSLSEFKFINSI
jgi:hypothetical protein